MTKLLEMLHDERATLARRLAGVDAAIHALNGSTVATVMAAVTGVKPGKRAWKMSAAARKKISLAQKKRWAKAKK
jgi:hypothetical protein